VIFVVSMDPRRRCRRARILLGGYSLAWCALSDGRMWRDPW